MKKAISLFLAIVITLSLSCPAFAIGSSITEGAIKVAYINNINNTGSNIGTDRSNPNAILNSAKYAVDFSLDSYNLSINGTSNGMPFSVSGNIATTNENQNLLLYEALDATGNYTVAYMSVERELDETALFFTDFHFTNPEYCNVIKLYMQPKNSSALIMIEIFLMDDFVLSLLTTHPVTYESDVADRIQCWFVNYYDPIEAYPSIQPAANTDYEVLDLTETYLLNGIRVTIHFVVHLYYPVANLIKGGSGTASFYFYIAESRTSSEMSANNSSTQSYMRLNDLNIKFSTMPYVICTSQQPYRHEIRSNQGFLNTDFYVSFGYAYGLISASGSLSFGDSKDMDTEAVPLPYTNTYGTKGTESGTLPSNLYISKQGAYYGMKVDYMDSGQMSRTGTMRVEFEYLVNNMYDYTKSYYDTFSDSFSVSVR